MLIPNKTLCAYARKKGLLSKAHRTLSVSLGNLLQCKAAPRNKYRSKADARNKVWGKMVLPSSLLFCLVQSAKFTSSAKPTVRCREVDKSLAFFWWGGGGGERKMKTNFNSWRSLNIKLRTGFFRGGGVLTMKILFSVARDFFSFYFLGICFFVLLKR